MISIPRSGSSRSLDMNAEERKIEPQPVVKHPLQDQWTLWYLENDRTKSWEDMQNRVTTFNTVEDFWCLQNHIVDPSILGDLNDYSLFKGDIRPMWEDQANKTGGRWILNISRQQRQHSRRSDLDDMWLDTMLYMIGGTSKFADDINGAVVNVRSRGDKISIWTANSHNNMVINGIGLELKQYLGTEARISYEAHTATGRSKPSFVL